MILFNYAFPFCFANFVNHVLKPTFVFWVVSLYLFAGSLIFVMTLCFSFTSFLSSFSSFFCPSIVLTLLPWALILYKWYFSLRIFLKNCFDCLLMLICLPQFPLALWQHNFVCFLCLFVFSNCYLLFLYLCRALLVVYFLFWPTFDWDELFLNQLFCIKFMGQGLGYGTI